MNPKILLLQNPNRIMRKYSMVDLIHFHRFASESKNKKKSMLDLVKAYNKKFPEIPAREQLKNLFNALGIKHNIK